MKTPHTAPLGRSFVSSTDFTEGPGQPEVRKSNPQTSHSLVMTPEMRGWHQEVKADSQRLHATLATTSGLGATGLPIPFWKRAVDLTGCIVALPFLALLTLFMYVVTRCVSPGPVFFQQERIGYMGRRFKIYKFRTMHVAADSSVHHKHAAALIRTNAPLVKLDNRGDARIIPCALLLRASGLDELPQIINVLRGEMSLVGPRPCLPVEFEYYVSWQRQRCNALPGLTGLWQVSGKNRTTFEEMLRFDVQYTRECSLFLDLAIILRTGPCLVAQVCETRRARKSSRQRAPRSLEKQPEVVLAQTQVNQGSLMNVCDEGI